MKRIFDFFFAGIMLILVLPIMVIVATLVRYKLGSPVLFKQTRAGYKGRPFTIYKFRTMKNLIDDNGKLLPDEERITPFGQMLRRYSLDELPQLFNVLKGDVSLVGPRPLLMEYLPLYNEQQRRRHDVKPGITGWAQINGRNGINWEEKFDLDIWYIDHYSFLLDIKIILLTVLKLFDSKGICEEGYVTAKDFKGSGNSIDTQRFH